jgi:hypothetical protein
MQAALISFAVHEISSSLIPIQSSNLIKLSDINFIKISCITV